MSLKRHIGLVLGDKKSSTLLYLSFIWSAVGLLTIYTNVAGSYAITYVGGLFAGMSLMYVVGKGGNYKVIKENQIRP